MYSIDIKIKRVNVENNLTVSKSDPRRAPVFLVEKIIREMVNSEYTLKEILNQYSLCADAFLNCLRNSHELTEMYSQMQQFKAELIAEDVIKIADTDFDAMRANNRIRARQWYASKMNAQKYGDKMQFDIKTNIDLAEALQLARARRDSIEDNNTQDAEFNHVQQPALTDGKSVKSLDDEASELLLADILK